MNFEDELKEREISVAMNDGFTKFFLQDLFLKIIKSPVSYRIYKLAKDKEITNEKLYYALTVRIPISWILPTASYYRRKMFVGFLNSANLITPLEHYNRDVEVYIFKFLDEVIPYII